MAGLKLLACFLTALFVAVECNCPNGWVTHDDQCYHFSHDSEDWPGAMAICKLLGGELVQIENKTEGDYLSNQAKLNTKSYWIGLTDVREEGSWRWVYSNALLGGPVNYRHWDKGQPDNGHGNQNCAYIVASSGKWADGTCHGALYYICERSSLYANHFLSKYSEMAYAYVKKIDLVPF